MSMTEEIVNISLQDLSQPIEFANFGTVFLYAKHSLTDAMLVFRSSDECLKKFSIDLSQDSETPDTDMAVYKWIKAAYSQSSKPEKIILGKYAGTPASELSHLKSKKDFRVMTTTSKDAEEQKLMAAWSHENNVIFISRTVSPNPVVDRTDDSAEVIDTKTSIDTSLADYVIENKFKTTACIYDKFDDPVDAGWAGEVLPQDMGTTWAHHELIGVRASEYSSSEWTTLKDKNINIYEKETGVTLMGTMLSGEFIDVVFVKLYTENKLQERLRNLLKQRKRIPFDNNGIGLIRSVVEQFFDDHPDIYDSVEITAKSASEVTEQHRQERKYEGLSWTARIKGAIHTLKVTGYIRA